MGGKNSKTKPNTEPPQPSRRGSLHTFIVSVDPNADIEDEVTSPTGKPHDTMSAQDGATGHSNGANISKVQEILEGKVELKKQQQLEHLSQPRNHIPSLDLQFSSSEDSDDSDDGGKRGSKGTKKKKKTKKSKPDRHSSVPSPVKGKLNDLKISKKAPTPGKKEYFEQIKDAYALAEYTSKEKDGGEDKNQAQSSPKSKQKQSPNVSPSRLFGGAFDGWKSSSLPQFSMRSNRSIVSDPRDASRASPPKSASNTPVQSHKSAPYGGSSLKSNDWARSTNESDSDSEWKEFERESDQFNRNGRISASASMRPPSDGKVTEERYAVTTTPTKPAKSVRNLRIDDTDESIMDDILAEVT